jgi:uncharacterized protein (TIGR02588 family)
MTAEPQPGMPILEIVLGALGGLAIVAIAGVLLATGLDRHKQHPEIVVELGTPEHKDGLWVVPFRAVNRTDAPATQVQLEAVLARESGERETSKVVLDHLAGGSEQEGGFFFIRDPATANLSARALGFVEP